MKLNELLSERMNIDWVPAWIQRSINNVEKYKNDLGWYTNFFKNLSNDQEFIQWKESNIKNPLEIKPRLKDAPDIPYAIMDAEHELFDQPIEHVITVDANVSRAPKDEKSTKSFVDRLSAVLTHELNHAHQQEKRMKGNDIDRLDTINDQLFKTPVPKAKTAAEQRFQYMLDIMETDAWLSQTAQEIKSQLGINALKNLNVIFNTAKKDTYTSVGGKIIDLRTLKTLYDALNHYEKYLKLPKETHWNKIKKELYGYISRSDK